MAQKNNPVKRNENLVVLSHEHHHGLIFCTRLKKASQTDDETLRSFVEDFWNNHLATHFISEEKMLLPLLRENAITARFLSEHYQIKKLVQSIVGKSKGVINEALNLSNLVNDHIRFEERTMFPWLEKALAPNELAAIGNKLEDTEISAHNFSPKFWKNED